MYACEIVSATSEKIVVESPKRFETKYMRESAIGLTGEVVLYLHDPRRRNRQAAHGSRFKVKFVRPPKGKYKWHICPTTRKLAAAGLSPKHHFRNHSENH